MNGNGELTGTHWIEETGLLTLPIGLTNSHAVGTVHRGIIDWVVARKPEIARDWLLPMVGATSTTSTAVTSVKPTPLKHSTTLRRALQRRAT